MLLSVVSVVSVVSVGGCGNASGSESLCGNGVIEAGERCDGDCPTTCADVDVCTEGRLIGSVVDCTAACELVAIEICADGDGCCAPGCDITLDSDCLSCDIPPDPPDLRVDLPTDEGAHAEDLEWWYWTGHLQATDGRWFGFQMTFFLSSYGATWGQVGHIAVTDVDSASYHYLDTYAFGRPPEVEGGYDLALPGMSAAGGQGRDILHGEVDGYVLDLSLVATKPPAFQHGNGYIDYPFGGNTYYYSRERMLTIGTLGTGTETLEITGASWFDHQWGALSPAQQIGWDWFALQLDDGREIMLFWVRDASADLLVGGSIIDAACSPTELSASDVSVTPTGTWTSPASGKTYPIGWDIEVAGELFHVTPVLEDQELVNVLPGVTYWEGACTVSGAATGRAYVELTQY